MGLFVMHEMFKKLNIGCALDEGLANPGEEYTVFYGEKSPWWMQVTARGAPGHGARLLENTAAEKIRVVINKFLDFRAQEEKRMKDGGLKLGDVTTVNLTILSGGVQTNVVPAELSATFDVRIPPTVDLVKFEEQARGWLAEAGEDIELHFLQKVMDQCVTDVTDKNPWWRAFKASCDQQKLSTVLEIFPAATDSRYLRALGISAIGFSPMKKTPILLHDHNEFLNRSVYLEGVDIYEKLLPAMTEH